MHPNNPPMPSQPPQQQPLPSGSAAAPLRIDINDFRASAPKFGSQYGPPPFRGNFPPSNQQNRHS